MIATAWLIAANMAAAAADPIPGDPATGDPKLETSTKFDLRDAVREGELPKSGAEAFIAQCGARKFETDVASNNAGKLRKAKIVLCAKPGDSDQQWIATLEKAATQIEASPELSATAKSKVVGEIHAAIARLRGEQAASLITHDLAQSGVVSGTPADQATVVPIAPAVTLPPAAWPAPVAARVPPPAPPPAPRRIVPAQLPVSKPRLSISCPAASDPGVAAPCFDLAADTLLMVRADEDLKTRVALRFIRDGDPRGGIALGMMRRGQIVRARLPARVCAGVVRGRVEVQTIVSDPHSGAEQVADTQGPFKLRC